MSWVKNLDKQVARVLLFRLCTNATLARTCFQHKPNDLWDWLEKAGVLSPSTPRFNLVPTSDLYSYNYCTNCGNATDTIAKRPSIFLSHCSLCADTYTPTQYECSTLTLYRTSEFWNSPSKKELISWLQKHTQ